MACEVWGDGWTNSTPWVCAIVKFSGLSSHIGERSSIQGLIYPFEMAHFYPIKGWMTINPMNHITHPEAAPAEVMFAVSQLAIPGGSAKSVKLSGRCPGWNQGWLRQSVRAVKKTSATLDGWWVYKVGMNGWSFYIFFFWKLILLPNPRRVSAHVRYSCWIQQVHVTIFEWKLWWEHCQAANGTHFQETLSSLWDLSKEAGEPMGWCGWNHDRNSATPRKHDCVVIWLQFLSEYGFYILWFYLPDSNIPLEAMSCPAFW